ncbi:hypothetical protein [Archangium primigenium]|uniref:hypothetical protein n=1 Tax=[Archangium] primigenium TaxID=2792470 RepID=UPI001959AB69|nr:hypothetical protein [Archangium primigenium]MBM7115527.1 hypothetical protein [Archangium primigenium]
MFRRLSVLMCSAWLATPLAVSAQNLSPEEIARIQLDEKAALKKIDAAHGGKKPSEMSNAERRQVIEEQQAARQAVMERHGVSDKDYARQTARMGPKQNEAVAAAQKQLEAQQKAAAAPRPASEEIIPVEIREEMAPAEGAAAAPAEATPEGDMGDIPVSQEEEAGTPIEQMERGQLDPNMPLDKS